MKKKATKHTKYSKPKPERTTATLVAERLARRDRAQRKLFATDEWNEGWDLSTIPAEVFLSEVQSRRAKQVQNRPGSVRSCGHKKWVRSCDVCQRNYKRTQYRIAIGTHPSVRETE